MDSSAYVGESKMVEITADGFESDPINGVDELDLLVVRLDAATEHALGDVDFVPLSDIDTRGSNAPAKVECMLGYPVSRHKRDKMFNRARRKVRLDCAAPGSRPILCEMPGQSRPADSNSRELAPRDWGRGAAHSSWCPVA